MDILTWKSLVALTGWGIIVAVLASMMHRSSIVHSEKDVARNSIFLVLLSGVPELVVGLLFLTDLKWFVGVPYIIIMYLVMYKIYDRLLCAFARAEQKKERSYYLGR